MKGYNNLFLFHCSKIYFFFNGDFSYFLSASSSRRRIASERELIRLSKRKSSMLVKRLFSNVINILAL